MLVVRVAPADLELQVVRQRLDLARVEGPGPVRLAPRPERVVRQRQELRARLIRHRLDRAQVVSVQVLQTRDRGLRVAVRGVRVRQRAHLDDARADAGLLHRRVVGVPVQQALLERAGVERVLGSRRAAVPPDRLAVVAAPVRAVGERLARRRIRVVGDVNGLRQAAPVPADQRVVAAGNVVVADDLAARVVVDRVGDRAYRCGRQRVRPGRGAVAEARAAQSPVGGDGARAPGQAAQLVVGVGQGPLGRIHRLGLVAQLRCRRGQPVQRVVGERLPLRRRPALVEPARQDPVRAPGVGAVWIFAAPRVVSIPFRRPLFASNARAVATPLP